MDDACDGGSEFTEALSVAVDSLVLHHLQRQQQLMHNKDNSEDSTDDDDADTRNQVVFEGTLRTKATLFSSKILEERGFEPVEELSRDMATHISKYEACLEHYAKRSIQSTSSGNVKSGGDSLSIGAGIRDRALQIVGLLGRLDPEVQREAAKKKKVQEEGEEYDPWANINMRR